MGKNELNELLAEHAQAARRVRGIYDSLGAARRDSIAKLGHTHDAALIVAGYLETYYTALETFFLRVFQFFENDLRPERWHAALLDKMTLAIPGVRAPVVSERNLSRLRELMRFRHFRRYDVAMDYDWTRIDFLIATLDAAHPIVMDDLTAFGEFLTRLEEAAGEERL